MLAAHPPPPVVTTGSKLDVLSRKECWRLVKATDLGRLAFDMAGWPLVLPVNYLVDGDDVVIRSDPGRKLAAARRQVHAALQVDSIDRGRDVASNLIELADRMADVVVVLVSARWTDPSHPHLSSVARRVTQHSHHPVLIVPAAVPSRPGTSDPGRGCPPRRTMPA